MVKEFIRNMMDWVLEKEEEAAKKCYLKPDDITKEILKIEQKKEQLQKECEENSKTLEDMIKRLEKIKQESLSCSKE